MKIFGELYAYNLSEAWANIRGYVLSMNGEADLQVVNRFSQQVIVEIVNHYHPGNGTFAFFPKTDHGMIEVGTMEEGVKLSNTPQYKQYLEQHFNYGIVHKTHEWIQDKLNQEIASK